MKPPQTQLPLGVRQEPSLGTKLETKGGKAEAVKRQADRIAEVCAEVYRLTGQKVTADDPILLAALFQSELMHRAAQDVSAQFQSTISQGIELLAGAVKAEREHAANIDNALASAYQQLVDGAKKAGDGELATIQLRFARMASETLDNVRREAQRSAPGGLGWRVALGVLSGVIVGLTAGVFMGQRLAPQFTDEQTRLLHNGVLLDEAWPRLPKSAREMFGVRPTLPTPQAGSQKHTEQKK